MLDILCVLSSEFCPKSSSLRLNDVFDNDVDFKQVIKILDVSVSATHGIRTSRKGNGRDGAASISDLRHALYTVSSRFRPLRTTQALIHSDRGARR